MTVLELPQFHTDCSGCSACAASCSLNAVSLKQDSEGFYYPVVDKEKCVDCSRCVSVCPMTQEYETNTGENAFSGYALDPSIREEGSSGGIFGLLAEKTLREGGVVYGAVFDEGSKTVMHKSTSEVSLQQILKSKYVESAVGLQFRNVKADLNTGRKVLFCGTPCQIKGLRAFLKTEHPNLLTIDFMCHGKPSTRLFQDMLTQDEGSTGSRITDVSFREKRYGWRKLHIIFYYQNGIENCSESNKNPFYYFFVNSYALRPSCYTCTCYNTHQADITLADYWETPEKDDKGTSLVICNTEIGKSAISELMVNDAELHSTVVQYGKYAHTPRKGYSIRNRERFFRAYKEKGFAYIQNAYFRKEQTKRKLVSDTKKIALLLRDGLRKVRG